jgi:integrase
VIARFSQDDEVELIRRFAASRCRPDHERCRLGAFTGLFRKMMPGQTPLNYTHCSDWVGRWLDLARATWAPTTVGHRLRAFARLANWMFHDGLIEDNVFAHTQVLRLLVGSEPPLVLRYNLQRLIEKVVAEDIDPVRSVRGHARCVLLRFNAHLNRHLPEPVPPLGSLQIGQSMIREWLRAHDDGLASGTVETHVRWLARCLDRAVREGLIAGHGLRSLLDEYNRRGLQGVTEACMAQDFEAALAPLRADPRFGSTLAGPIQGFLAERGALGYRVASHQRMLANFDRFLRGRPPEAQQLSQALLEQWLATAPMVGSKTRFARFRCVRQLAQYVQAGAPDTYVPPMPEPCRFPPPRPPYIYAREEIGRLLHASLRLGPPGSLRPRTVHALVALLYGGGLRIGEALRLDVGDIDVKQGLLLIRETKFYKTRWVPLSPSVATCISRYLADRAASGFPTDADTATTPSPERSSCCSVRWASAALRERRVQDCTICGTRSPSIASRAGTRRVPTCARSCLAWRPTLVTSRFSPPRRT